MALAVKRSDLFPIGTTVGAYPFEARHHNAVKPSGTPLETAVVDATGSLSFPGLAAGIYVLWSEVSGAQAYLLVSNVAWTEPGTLPERIAAQRAAVGA